MNLGKITLTFCFTISILTSGCATTSKEGPNWATKAVLCTGGGLIGSYAAKKLASMYFEKSGKTYTVKEQEYYTKAFQLGLFVTFCEIANYAGNTIYKKLSEDGAKKRKAKVLEAASTAQTTTYSDPSNPELIGSVTPTKTYIESAGRKECVDMEDTLADTNNSETIYIKYCRALPNGNYEPVSV